MKPSIGRIVHFVTLDGTHRPAIVVKAGDINVDRQMVDLIVFLDPTIDNTIPFQRGVPCGDSKDRRTWHWPEREE